MRALPAVGIAGEGGPLAAEVGLLAGADDIAIAFGADEDAGEAVHALALACDRGCRTTAFSPARAEHEFDPVMADAQIRQEFVETFYTCCGSSFTSSSSTAACSKVATGVRCTTPERRASSTCSSASARTTCRKCSTTSVTRPSSKRRRPRR